jgi:hypothetical protein
MTFTYYSAHSVYTRGVTCGLEFGKGQMSINGHNIFNGHIMPL